MNCWSSARSSRVTRRPRVRLAQEWKTVAGIGDELRDAFDLNFAAWQRGTRCPRRSGRHYVRKAVKCILGKAAIGRDLATIDTEQRRILVAFVKRKHIV